MEFLVVSALYLAIGGLIGAIVVTLARPPALECCGACYEEVDAAAEEEAELYQEVVLSLVEADAVRHDTYDERDPDYYAKRAAEICQPAFVQLRVMRGVGPDPDSDQTEDD